jgi:hypothetical protein
MLPSLYRPDNWLPNATRDFMLSFCDTWIRRHVADAATLDKPLLVEEFGKIANRTADDIVRRRDPFFDLVYGYTARAAALGEKAGGQGQGGSSGGGGGASSNPLRVLRGALFWQWDEGVAKENPLLANRVRGKKGGKGGSLFHFCPLRVFCFGRVPGFALTVLCLNHQIPPNDT